MYLSVTIGWWAIPVIATIIFLAFMLMPGKEQDTYGVGAALDGLFGLIFCLFIWVGYLTTALIWGIR